MTRIMAIDAGLSTGVAVVDFPEGKPPAVEILRQSEDSLVSTVAKLRSLFLWKQPDVIVAEKFNLRPGNQFLADLSTVYVNGAMEWEFANYHYTPIYWQTPAQAKGLVRDKILKRLGPDFWPTGKTVGYKDANDARDALRHAVHYAVVTLEHHQTIEVGWPRTEEESND